MTKAEQFVRSEPETDMERPRGAPPPVRATLRLLHLSDVHAHLHPWDYHEDRPAPRVGLAAAAGLIERLRAEAANSLLFDGGDMLQGAPIADAAQGPGGGEPEGPHPVIAAMNAIGVDAAAFGNHDFNYGLEAALRIAGQARFPVVLANLRAPHGGALLSPWAMLERELTDEDGRPAPLRVGVFGLCPPQTTLWDAVHLAGRAVAEDLVETAAALVPRMRAAGCDLVIALCHSGVAPDPAPRGAENAALAVARVPGIDAILTGHQHMRLPGPDFDGIAGVDAAAGRLHGVPALMPGHRAEHVGVIDLSLVRRDGRWSVHRAACRLERTPPLEAEAAGRRAGDLAPERRAGPGTGAETGLGIGAALPQDLGIDGPEAARGESAAAGRDAPVGAGADGMLRIARAPGGVARTDLAPGPVRSGAGEASGSGAALHAPTPGFAAPAPVPALARRVFDASRAAHRATLDEARRPAGRLAGPLHTWFAMVAESPAVRLMNMAQRRRAAQLLAGSPWAALPLLSAAAPFKAGWRAGPHAYLSVHAGPVRRRHLHMLMPFPNTLRIAVVTGEALRLWLERSAACWAHLTRGAGPAPLLSRAAAPYNLDLIDGVEWDADLSRPPMFTPEGAPLGGSGRVVSMRHDGREIAPADQFAVATNSYRLGGGGRFPGMPGIEEAPIRDEPAKAALFALMDSLPEVDPTPGPGLRLTGLPKAGAVLRTSPDAPHGAAAADAAGGLQVEDCGIDAEGFGLRRLRA